MPVLRASSTAVGGDRAAGRSYGTLLALQVGLSVTLLVVTTLFVTSFMRVLNADRGFVPERVLAVDVAFPATRYADESVRQNAYDRLLTALHALPGVERAATTSLLPLRGQAQVNFIATPGQSLRSDLSDLPSANFRFVAPEFFRTLGIEIRRGRSFTNAERDPKRPAPALVSEPAAARLWPGENPLGKQFSRGIPSEQGFEVVGVVADARTTALDREQPLMVYVPYWWRSRPWLSLLIQTTVDAASMLPAVRRAIREIDPEIAVGEARPLDRSRRGLVGRPPATDAALRGIRDGRVVHRLRRRLRRHVVHRLAPAAGDEHPRGARRAAPAGGRPDAAARHDPGARRRRPASAARWRSAAWSRVSCSRFPHAIRSSSPPSWPSSAPWPGDVRPRRPPGAFSGSSRGASR